MPSHLARRSGAHFKLGIALVCLCFASGAAAPVGLSAPEASGRLEAADAPAAPEIGVPLQEGGPTWQVGGGLANAKLGTALASAGDVNGDGIADILVGASGYDSPASSNPGEGRALVYLGSPTGPSTIPIWTDDGAQRGFGAAVASAGDVNGDGFDDIIVGEPDLQTPPPDAWWGQASLYLGSASGPAQDPSWVKQGNATAGRFGAAVASAGDVNNDGYDDVLVGAPGVQYPDPAKAFLYLGSPSGLSENAAWSAAGGFTPYAERFGSVLSSAGDVNGDGYDDVLVGEPGYAENCKVGRTYLYGGMPTGLSFQPIWTLTGQARCDYQSTSVGCSLTSGHFDGDAYSDFVVGCVRDIEVVGSVLFRGSPFGPAASSWMVSGTGKSAGDVNGDSFDDMILGDVGVDASQQPVYRISIYPGGASGLSTAPVWAVILSKGSQLNTGPVAGAGDTDGDQLDNVLVGLPGYDFTAGQPKDGAAFLFFGPVAVPCSTDADGDGYCATGPADDCDDTVSSIHPNGVEICNGADDNCDARIDEGFGVGAVCTSGFGICKVSGVGACAADGTARCDAPPPGAPAAEVCDGVDNDCDNLIDDGLPDSCRIASTPETGARLGSVVANVGDVNHDGFDDVLAGAPGGGPQGHGTVSLYYGSASGAFRSPDWTAAGTQLDRALPRKASYGAAVAGIGDVNRDGIDDFIVGAPGYDYFQYQTVSGSVGTAYLFLGSPTGPHLPVQLFDSATPSAFGSVVGGGGDVDGDGADDFVVAGAGSFLAVLPRIVLFTHGGATRTVRFGQNFGQFGRAVAIAPDINGDGFDDLLVAASFPQAVLVYHGQSSGIPSSPSLTLPIGFGAPDSVAGLGDVNGDGYGDILVGSDDTTAGTAALYLGSAAGVVMTPVWTRNGDQNGSKFGRSVAPAGDVNQDGFADLIVGAPNHAIASQVRGAAFLFLGGSAGPDQAPVWTGSLAEQAGAQFGAAVSGGGDYDDDGFPDLILGAPGFDSGNAPGAGRVDLVLTQALCSALDADQDSISDCADNCRGLTNADQADADGDGPGDPCDNCPANPNPVQEDADGDEAGNVCDPCTDTDGDGAGNPGFAANTCPLDNCPSNPNPGQSNADSDGLGDACDPCTDPDGDGFGSPGFLNQCPQDNCPLSPNPDQTDIDRDGAGDVCDTCPFDVDNDIDHDSVCGNQDNCPLTPNPGQEDGDGDLTGDVCDNCPDLVGTGFPDQDGDAWGDDCDNCPAHANADQADGDDDGSGDVCDNCPAASNPGQEDANQDGSGNACQPAVSITEFRHPSPEVIEALVSASDPQGEGLSGTVAIESTLDLHDALETMDCERAYLPDGEPGRGVAFGNSFGDQYLFDLDSMLECDDGTADFEMAYGACRSPQGPFDAFLAIAGLTLPFPVCVRPAGGQEGGTDWTLVAMLPDRVTVLIADRPPVLEVPFTSTLPDAIDISTLALRPHALSITVTDGNTVPVTGSGIFQHTSETTLRLVPGGSGPVAALAAPASVECSGGGGATVALDGSGSTDPDSTPGTNDDIASFDWYENYGTAGQQLLGSGETLAVNLPLGTHSITLVATDHAGRIGLAAATVTVVDTQPPSLTLSTDLGSLWPPNHRLVPVGVSWQVGDACDPAGVGVALVSVTSSEPDDAPAGTDGATTLDVQSADIGAADATVVLRAERDALGTGRVYTLTYRATDGSGNSSTALATVTVPHDLGQGPEPLLMQIEPAAPGAAGVRIVWPTVTGATGYDVITGDLQTWRVENGALDVGPVRALARATTATTLIEPDGGAATPPVGQAFFYLIQHREGARDFGYGTESAPLPRVASICEGGCPGAP